MATARERRYGNPPKRPAKALRDAAAAGRGGDSILAHIGPEEAALLKARGGAGTPNPTTGLPEFTTAATDPKGSEGTSLGGAGGDTQASGHQTGGATSSGGTQGPGAGAVGSSTGLHETPRGNLVPDVPTSPKTSEGTSLGGAGGSTEQANGAKPSGNLNLGAPGTLGTPDLDAMAAAGTGLTKEGYTQAAGNMGTAYADYKDYGNSFMQDVGNFLASYGGFNEINPTKQDIKHFAKQDQADWGFDPAGAIGGAAGMAAGVPFGGGLIADLASRALGRPLEVNLGPDVMGAAKEFAGVGSGTPPSRASRYQGGKRP